MGLARNMFFNSNEKLQTHAFNLSINIRSSYTQHSHESSRLYLNFLCRRGVSNEKKLGDVEKQLKVSWNPDETSCMVCAGRRTNGVIYAQYRHKKN